MVLECCAREDDGRRHLFLVKALAFVILAVACTAAPPGPDTPGTRDDCREMCAQLESLRCDFATPDCVDACWNVESSATHTICPELVKTAGSCEQAKELSVCDSR
jgi:hypothetical protein